jgi:hypothetical protein
VIGLLAPLRQCVRVDMGTTGYLGLLGHTVSLTHPRINGGNEWFARVIGHEIDASRRRISLILWG